MSNLYVTPAEIKDNAPDAIRAATTKYDDVLTRMAGNASRDIDRWCRRVFYPWSGVRTFNGGGKRTLWIDDVISISQLRYSDDNGADRKSTRLNSSHSQISYSLFFFKK